MSTKSKATTVRSPTSTRTPGPKPTNVFYVWYAELCRRANTSPLAYVKPARPKNDTVLDFTCDRIKLEEWTPILNALKQDMSLHVVAIRSKVECKFLPEIDTEKKAKEMKRKGGFLHTDFVLGCLIEALCHLISKTQVLMYLELDGLPITQEYLGPIIDALSRNKSLKVLSFKYCPLKDEGCQQLCQCLKNVPNVEVLNLTGCGLGSMSAQYIAKVIRYQQINRYCESWHCSLRYEDPDVELMTGLKRITLNCNPNIGDEGLAHILNELDDDLWIKALDMQRCNISENIAKRLLDVIEYSRSLEIADFRHNDQLTADTIKQILDILKTKQHFGYDNEYEWCLTATTLPYEHSVQEVPSNCSTNLSRNRFQKSRSASFKDIPKKISLPLLPIRRIKSSTKEKSIASSTQQTNKEKEKEDVSELSAQLQREIARRVRTEKENKELQKKLENLQAGSKHEMKNVKFKMERKSGALPRTKESLSIKIPRAVANEDPDPGISIPVTPKNSRATAIVKEKKEEPRPKDEGVEFVFTIEDNHEKSVAQSLFENLLYTNCDESDSDGDNDILDYYNNDLMKPDVVNDDGSDNGSNASLLKFMESIKKSVKFDSFDCGRENNKTNWESKSNKVSIVH